MSDSNTRPAGSTESPVTVLRAASCTIGADRLSTCGTKGARAFEPFVAMGEGDDDARIFFLAAARSASCFA